MTLTLVLRKDKKGRYWLTRYTGENASSTQRVTCQVTQEVADLLEGLSDSLRDGQRTLWS